jgi:predicted dinucleotide-binding enzyme
VNKYYPDRDGSIDALDRRETKTSQLIANHFQGATIIKAFKAILEKTSSILLHFQTEPSVPCRLGVTMPPTR